MYATIKPDILCISIRYHSSSVKDNLAHFLIGTFIQSRSVEEWQIILAQMKLNVSDYKVLLWINLRNIEFKQNKVLKLL